MQAVRQFLSRLMAVGRRRNLNRQIADEINFHVERQTAAYIESGMPPDDARRRALIEFGGAEQIKEETRDENTFVLLEQIVQDISFALRGIRKQPGFTAVVICILALGVGANTAIFSIVDAVLLRALPYRHSEGLLAPVAVFLKTGTTGRAIPYKDYLIWKQQKNIFREVAVVQETYGDLAYGTAPAERVMATRVSEDFFSVLDAGTLLGRTFTAGDHANGAERTIVISEHLWRTRFGSDPTVLGRRLYFRGLDWVVIGVAGRDADFPMNTEIWLPAISSNAAAEPVDNFAWLGIARLAPGITLDEAKSFITAVGKRAAAEFPAKRSDTGTSVITLSEAIVGTQIRRALFLVLGAVGIVLLIGCANLANLILSRAVARRREFSIRCALGATSSRLVRQMLVEAGLLSLIGSAVGLLLCGALVKALIKLAPQDIPRLSQASIDWRVVVFAVATGVITAVLFAIAPALTISRQDPRDALQQGGQSLSEGRTHRHMRQALVAVEVALSLVLLVGAGLLVRSFGQLQATDPGVITGNMLTFDISLPSSVYPKDEQTIEFISELERRIDSIPGVVAAGGIGALPIGGGGFYLGRSFIIEGKPLPPTGTEYAAMWNITTPDFFKASGIHLLSGRRFTAQDNATSPPVVIISQTLADQMFPGINPVGKYIRSWRDDNKAREIVGLVSDVTVATLDERPQGSAYVPHAQDPWGILAFVVRTTGDPHAYISLVRHELDALNPNIAMGHVNTMAAIHDDALAQSRFSMMLMFGFAAIALILATAGLFGVTAYTVNQQGREIGIRMALGGNRVAIVRLVLLQAFKVVGIGYLAGIIVALLSSRMLEGVLYKVHPFDSAVYGSVTVVLTLAAAGGVLVPARRAVSVDPMQVLRHD
ncbi:MAG TPA: ABC transporter permease [Terriglobales bacterium]|nr:ABC transporter permease [Terriglobales bacterium]